MLILFIASFTIFFLLIEIFTKTRGDSILAWLQVDFLYWLKYHFLPSVFLAGSISCLYWFQKANCHPAMSPIACQFDLTQMPDSLRRQITLAEQKTIHFHQRAKGLILKRRKIAYSCKRSSLKAKCDSYDKEILNQINVVSNAKKSLRSALDTLYLKLEHEGYRIDSLNVNHELKGIETQISTFENEIETSPFDYEQMLKEL